MSVLCDLGISMLKQQSLRPFCLFSCGDGGISITVAVTLLLVSEKQRLWYRWASQQPKISPDLAITQFELSLPAHISDTITALIIYRRIRIKRYCICKQINGPRVNNYNASIEEVHNTKCISHKINSINLKSPRSCWRQLAGESFFRRFLPCLCSESVENLWEKIQKETLRWAVNTREWSDQRCSRSWESGVEGGGPMERHSRNNLLNLLLHLPAMKHALIHLHPVRERPLRTGTGQGSSTGALGSTRFMFLCK